MQATLWFCMVLLGFRLCASAKEMYLYLLCVGGLTGKHRAVLPNAPPWHKG